MFQAKKKTKIIQQKIIQQMSTTSTAHGRFKEAFEAPALLRDHADHGRRRHGLRRGPGGQRTEGQPQRATAWCSEKGWMKVKGL